MPEYSFTGGTRRMPPFERVLDPQEGEDYDPVAAFSLIINDREKGTLNIFLEADGYEVRMDSEEGMRGPRGLFATEAKETAGAMMNLSSLVGTLAEGSGMGLAPTGESTEE